MSDSIEAKTIFTGKDIVDYIYENGLEDAEIRLGVEGYSSSQDLAIAYNGEHLWLVDCCMYEEISECL